MDDLLLRIVALVLLIAVLIGISGYQIAHEPTCPAGSTARLVKVTWYCTVEPVKP